MTIGSITQIRDIIARNVSGRAKASQNLNIQPHFVPMNFEVLEKVLGDKLDPTKMTLTQFRSGLIDYVLARHKIKLRSVGGKLYYNSIEITLDNIIQYTPAAIFSGTEMLGTLYSSKVNSFKNIGTGLLGYLNSKEITRALKRNNTGYSKGFDIGHTEINTEDGVLAVTPVSIQLDGVLTDTAEILYSDTLTETERQIIESAYLHMSAIRVDFDIHATYGATILSSMSKSFTDSLLSLNVNIVVIQERNENRYWGSNIEQRVISELKSVIANIHFSRSLTEEIEYRVVSALTGKKAPNTTKKVSAPNIEIKAELANLPKSALGLKVPKARKTSAAPLSLVKLKNLINAKLMRQIDSNMGNGNRKDILNFRTGRFAASANVEGLTVSRLRQISAFYTYMKNPYQTFEPGFNQGSPKTRNPKLLISKSIREIAASIVTNKLRTVLV